MESCTQTGQRSAFIIIFYFHLFPALCLTTVLATKSANLKAFLGGLYVHCVISAEFSEKGAYLEGKEQFL